MQASVLEGRSRIAPSPVPERLPRGDHGTIYILLTACRDRRAYRAIGGIDDIHSRLAERFDESSPHKRHDPDLEPAALSRHQSLFRLAIVWKTRQVIVLTGIAAPIPPASAAGIGVSH